jgi:hypothetical protein
MFNMDLVFCTDDIVQAINVLKDHIDYWQSDLLGLI